MRTLPDGAAAHWSCRPLGIKLLVADALEVIQHPSEDIPRDRDFASVVLNVHGGFAGSAFVFCFR